MTSEGGFAQIEVTREDRIAVIRLDRPEAGNAFTAVMRRELDEALTAADADDDIRAIVLTGNGRHFCVGADLAGNAPDQPFGGAGAGQADTQPAPAFEDGVLRDGGGVVSLRAASTRTPIIAAFNGAAVGVGVTMTLPMDIRIAARTARFGFVFARRGIVPEAASSWFLPRIVGISRAMDWVATGRLISAEEALEAGLVSQVVEPEELLPTAMRVAADIRDNTSALSIAIARQLLWAGLSEPSPWWAHERESHILPLIKQGPDAAEGVTSFIEKRPAHFTARVSEHYPDVAPVWPGDGSPYGSRPRGRGEE
ncbi:enoyl-CoA hydratase-related protein [Microbacterium sp. X-17]|uniref:enoyl-CoA hydratase-related protein n=1 Tax=Microbacterium sp. X-17 TaxID=3144404 RepID=UPI0031F49A22